MIMDPSTASVVWLLAGLVAFPLIVLVYVSHSRIKLRRFLSFIARADNIAVGYNKQLIDLYKAIVFIPNVLGVLGDIVAKYYNSLGIQETTVLQLLFFHLGLLVVSLIVLGMIEMAGTRILL